MKETKKARIIRDLKTLVLRSSDGVSRQEASEALAVDLRTAAAYLERLADEGLFRREHLFSGRKGRPGQIYLSNAEALCFLGLAVTQNLSVSATVIDSAGNILLQENGSLPQSGSRLGVFTAIRDFALRFREVRDKRLYGIGLAISRWLQPPLSGEDTYANLSDYLARETGVAVHRDVNINAVAYEAADRLHKADLAVLHAGLVIEFGLVRGGEPERDFVPREAWLSHLCVNPKGRQCYCGRYGCLENYVTRGALNEILKPPLSPAVRQSLGEMLASALRRLARKYRVDTVLLFGVDEIFPEVARLLRSASGEPPPELLRYDAPPQVSRGAALEAAHFELHRFACQADNHFFHTKREGERS